MRLTSLILPVCIALGALAASAPSAWALKYNFATEPIKINAKPGDMINRTFWLTLAKDEKPTRFKAHMEDWWRSEDGKQSFYREPGTLSRSCASWIKLNPVESVVGPGETLNVRLSISVPPDVKPGGYWAALTVDEIPDPLDNPGGIGIRFVGSLSVGVFINITPLDKQARIVDVQIHPDRAEIKLRNDGNCPLPVEGRFEFYEPGAKQAKAVAQITRSTLLPEPINTALISVSLPDAKTLPAGRYQVRVILDIGLEHYIGAQKLLDIQRHEAPTHPKNSDEPKNGS